MPIIALGDPVPTTLNDFFLPGSQPNQSGNLEGPDRCNNCHDGYDKSVEPAFNWRGSMMSQAARDPLFFACLAIANQDAPQSGDLCLRCHTPTGWLEGRSQPTDGSALTSEDREGVQCDNCHKFVKPTNLGVNPYPDDSIYTADTYPEDQNYLATIDSIPQSHANGMFIVDSNNAKRGPFADAEARHQMFYSPFHSDENYCGTCHDVSNPVYARNGGNYVPNSFDQPSPSFDPYTMFPIERTFSEWKMSEYKTTGVYAPQFGGNKDIVSTCQDCHLHDVTGVGCNKQGAPLRNDLPLHDMTGGNTFIPDLVQAMFPGEIDPEALDSGLVRAAGMLRKAASMSLSSTAQDSTHRLDVNIINETAHKLPSGYPEGRRIWLNVRAYNTAGILVFESGQYDTLHADLIHDDDIKIYEIKPGVSNQLSPVVNLPVGPSFHFVLNDSIFKDNRIPPRGFTNANFDSIQSPPVAYSYTDGQYWDDTYYNIPGVAAKVVVTLYYQTTSKEYVEFLRDENSANQWGDTLYSLWASNGKSRPEIMAVDSLSLQPLIENNPPVALCHEITANADSSCQAEVSIDNGSYDPDGDGITIMQVPPGPYHPGQTTTLLIVTDNSGAADTCQAIITVNDATPPTIICPSDIQAANDTGQCGAVVSFEITASDNCGSTTVTTTPSSGSFFDIGSTAVEAVARDSSGNTDTCYFTVSIRDNEPPALDCPDSVAAGNDPGQCGATVDFSVTATDNCAVTSLETSPPSGSYFPLGRTPVMAVATDSSGNADTCSFSVIVNDIEPPVISCPNDTTVQCLDYILPIYTGYAQAIDNCDDSLEISFTDMQAGAVFTRTWTALDDFGNADTCFQTIVVNDTTAPTISCPGDTVVESDSGICGAVVEFAITAVDNCDSVTITVDPASGNMFPVGTTAITAVAIDGGGNSDTCTFRVTVLDTEAPAISCPQDTVLDNEAGACGATVNFVLTATDNCGVAEISSTPATGTFFSVGITTVQVVAADSTGNADTCYFTVEIRDVEPPTVQCPEDTIVAAEPDTNGAFVEYSSVASDNCSIAESNCQPPSGSFFPTGTTTVICAATDSSGNIDSCSFSIIVTSQSGCSYIPGDVNGSNTFNGLDVTYSVAYFKGGALPPYSCECTPGNTWYVAGDVNASCTFNGLDVTYMVAYFKGGPAIQPCQDCPPAR